MRIGYKTSFYGDHRNIIGRIPDFLYRRVYNGRFILPHLSKIGTRIGIFDKDFRADLPQIFNDFGLNPVDVIHLFNAVSLGRRPWVSTFETAIPRFALVKRALALPETDLSSLADHPRVRAAIRAMAHPSCKAILALSQCNAGIQRHLLQHFPEYSEFIDNKLEVLHPPQSCLVDSFKNKGISLDGPIHFIFVGASFHRKGGIETVEVMKELRQTHGYDLKLTIISAIAIDNYATGETQADITAAKKLIDANSDWISYHSHMSNTQVLETMRSAHVGMLPTYADTYGYAVLEMQAAGCPVITTNVRALPEINSEEKGWVIEVPRNVLGEGRHQTPEGRRQISAEIRAGIARALHQIFADRTVIAQKAAKAISHIQAFHDPDAHARALKAIYTQAVS